MELVERVLNCIDLPSHTFLFAVHGAQSSLSLEALLHKADDVLRVYTHYCQVGFLLVLALAEHLVKVQLSRQEMSLLVVALHGVVQLVLFDVCDERSEQRSARLTAHGLLFLLFRSEQLYLVEQLNKVHSQLDLACTVSVSLKFFDLGDLLIQLAVKFS